MDRIPVKLGVMMGAMAAYDALINRCHECGGRVKNAPGEPYTRHRVRPRGWPNPVCGWSGKVKP